MTRYSTKEELWQHFKHSTDRWQQQGRGQCEAVIYNSSGVPPKDHIQPAFDRESPLRYTVTARSAHGSIIVTQQTVLWVFNGPKNTSALHDSILPCTVRLADKLRPIPLRISSDREAHISRLGYCCCQQARYKPFSAACAPEFTPSRGQSHLEVGSLCLY